MAFPGRAETEEQLASLADGRSSPDEVADWAQLYVTDEDTHPDRMDPAVWEALTLLSGADLRSSPNEYLHGRSDFERWLNHFRETVRGAS